VLYVMTYSLPSDSVIEDAVPFFGNDLESILNQGLALYLAFFSSILLPNLTEITVRKMVIEMRSGNQHALQTIMAIVARTLLVIVVPCVAVVVFNDGCYRGWMKLWTPCKAESAYFTKSVSVPYLQYVDIPNIPQYDSIDLSLVKRKAICDLSYQSGTCARSMLGVLAPLLLKKMMYAVLFTAVEPLQGHVAESFCRMRCFAMRQTREDQAASMPIATTTKKRPDPMRRLVWFETALAFGGLVPLLLPLLALQLHAGSYIFEWHLRRAPSSEPHSSSSPPAVVLPVLRRAMQMHSVVVLAIHSFLVAFFFRDSDLHGATGLVVALCAIWFTFALATGWDIPMLDVLLCRWRPRKRRYAPGEGGRSPTGFLNPILVHMREQQILEERRGLVAGLCVMAALVAGGVWLMTNKAGA